VKDQLRHYVVFLPEADAYDAFKQAHFQKLHDPHWQIEQYHRMIKQVCNIEKFQVRGKVPILNHLFAALCSYVHLQRMQFTEIISNAYQWQKALYKDVVASFVTEFMIGKEYLNPQFQPSVNA
ncbi:MAG: IS701 family transposase, partial [Methylovulum sp.]